MILCYSSVSKKNVIVQKIFKHSDGKALFYFYPYYTLNITHIKTLYYLVFIILILFTSATYYLLIYDIIKSIVSLLNIINII